MSEEQETEREYIVDPNSATTGANSGGENKPTPTISQRPGSASRRPGSSAGRPPSSSVSQRRKIVTGNSTSNGSSTTSPTLATISSSSSSSSRNVKTLWDVILETKKEQVTSMNDPIECNVLIMGGERSGKSCLVHRILKRDYQKDAPEKSIALDYSFGKRDEGLKTYIANMWELAGGRSLVKLLKENITAENIHTMVAVIVLDLTKPIQLFEDFIYFHYVLTKISEDLYSMLKQKGSDIPDKMMSRAKKRFGEQHEDL